MYTTCIGHYNLQQQQFYFLLSQEYHQLNFFIGMLYYGCRDTQNQWIVFVGILLGSCWHLWVRTLSGFGLLDQGVKGNVFMNLAVMAISFMHLFSTQRTLHCWSLAVTRQVCILFYSVFHFFSFFFGEFGCLSPKYEINWQRSFYFGRKGF